MTKALNLDQSIAEAHASMAWVSLWENGNLDQSDINLRRAEELNDTSANIHNYKGLFLMIQGKFKSFKHLHFFEEKEGVTIMTDILEYETPLGFLGKFFDTLFLKKHLEKFLLERNQILKKLLENNKP